MNIRELAIYRAGAAHGNQMYGESPYLYHLVAVDEVLDDVGFSQYEAVRIAGLLHDTLEDSKEARQITREDIEREFGTVVAELVWRVTNEQGANRKEKAKATYPKIAENQYSVAVKLADRIANLEQSNKTFSKFGQMYWKEDDSFRAALSACPITDMRIPMLWRRYKAAIDNVKQRYGVYEYAGRD